MLSSPPASAQEVQSDVPRTIGLDVARTCAEVPYFARGDGAAVLARVLLAFARFVPGTSYVQGMSNLAAFVLLAFRGGGGDWASPTSADLEADAFWTLTAVVQNRLSGYFDKGMGALLGDTAVLAALVERHSAPAAVRTLKAVEFEWLFVTPDWFVHLFFDGVPPRVALHVWDLILWHGHNAGHTSLVLFWVVLGIVERCSGVLSGCGGFQEVIDALRCAALEVAHVDDLRAVSSVSVRDLEDEVPTIRAGLDPSVSDPTGARKKKQAASAAAAIGGGGGGGKRQPPSRSSSFGEGSSKGWFGWARGSKDPAS